jgi:hypothetical protein
MNQLRIQRHDYVRARRATQCTAARAGIAQRRIEACQRVGLIGKVKSSDEMTPAGANDPASSTTKSSSVPPEDKNLSSSRRPHTIL